MCPLSAGRLHYSNRAQSGTTTYATMCSSERHVERAGNSMTLRSNATPWTSHIAA
jgi:hypothetical protein